MAKSSKTTKTSFYEVVIQGKPKVVRAFLSGLILGADQAATVFYSFDEGVYHEGKAERLKELVGVRTKDCHVIVDAGTSALIKQLKRRIVAETGLDITAHRRIRSASVYFKFHAYAPHYNREIVDLVKQLPAGLKLGGFKHEEKHTPDAKGVEAYASVHHYEACGEATISGPVDLVIGLKRRFADFPLIDSDDVILKLA